MWVAALALGLFVLGAVPADVDEGLLLRWLRTCADHPVRVLIASLLLVYSVRCREGPD